MALTRDEMLRRFLTRDRKSDGLFVTGVLTTGIFCLPSCSARKPRPENVRFFPDPAAAREFGLRACRRCRPEAFYQGREPELERLEALTAAVRARPGDFADAGALAREAGIGLTKLSTLFRDHEHTTPAQFLVAARVDRAAAELLGTGRRVVDVGLDAGFESQSAFHENFLRRTGMTPGAYRRLGSAAEFRVRLPEGFRPEEALAVLGRGPEQVAERVTSQGFVKAHRLGGAPRRLEVRLARGVATCVIHGRASRVAGREAHRLVVRLLGLDQDPGPFERRAARRGFRRLVEGRRGLRIPRTADPFEALVWVVVGQQVNVAFASACRDRLILAHGPDAGDGMRAHPSAEELARLEVGDLRRLKLTRRKAEYLIDASRAIVAGTLDLDGLARRPADRIAATLLAVRGLGVWSVQYMLMRAYGLADCVPVGDSALGTSLQEFFGLEARPGPEETRSLMRPFAPDRSLATFHLWKRLGDPA